MMEWEGERNFLEINKQGDRINGKTQAHTMATKQDYQQLIKR